MALSTFLLIICISVLVGFGLGLLMPNLMTLCKSWGIKRRSKTLLQAIPLNRVGPIIPSENPLSSSPKQHNPRQSSSRHGQSNQPPHTNTSDS